MKLLLTLLITLCTALGFQPCFAESTVPLARITVDGRVVNTDPYFFKKNDIQKIPKSVSTQIHEQLVELALIEKELNRRGLLSSPEVWSNLQQARSSVYYMMLADDIRKHLLESTPDLKERMAQVKAQPVHDVLLREMQLPDEATGRQVLELLKQGQPFGDVARQFSKDSWATDGGLIGWTEMKELSEAQQNAVRSLQVGAVSPVFQEGEHWMIVQLLDQKMTKNYDDDQLRMLATDDLLNEQFKQLMERLRKQHRVRIYSK